MKVELGEWYWLADGEHWFYAMPEYKQQPHVYLHSKKNASKAIKKEPLNDRTVQQLINHFEVLLTHTKTS